MGSCCPTLRSDYQGSYNPRSPLLGRRVVPSYTGTGPTQPPVTYRRYKAADPSDPDSLAPISIRPVKVSIVDKQLNDHARLFNDHLERYEQLRELYDELKTKFLDADPPDTVTGCFGSVRLLVRYEMDTIKVKRSYQYCMQIVYPSRSCPAAVECFDLFNDCNKLTKEIMDKGHLVLNSVELVITNERQLRREVLVASLGDDGPQCMKNCMENVVELKKVASHIEDIRKSTHAIFDDLQKATVVLTDRDLLPLISTEPTDFYDS